MGNAISKAFFGRPITITGIIAIISYLVYYRRKKRLLLEKKKKEEAEKQNNSDGFDGKGQIVVETLSKRKSLENQSYCLIFDLILLSIIGYFTIGLEVDFELLLF